MNDAINRPTSGRHFSCLGNRLILIAIAWLLAACGGGSAGQVAAATSCDPSNPSATECGTLLLGLTDADGDFLSYSVDVVSLTLTKANGTTVETLPATTRMDFAQYIDLTEFVTAASVPPGTYVAGSVTLDYRSAAIFVEVDGNAREAVVVDRNGTTLGQTTLDISLSEHNHLTLFRGSPSWLTVDFDLTASHRVDTATVPAIVTAEPVIIAEIDPVDSKDIRVRGVFIDANVDEMTYTVAMRPFHRHDGNYGRFTVHVAEDTEFEVDGALWTGVEGLRALRNSGAGTLTVAQGTLDVSRRLFTANIVLAGSSVPGIGGDTVKGNVIARAGDTLTVRGATVIPQDERAFFRDNVTVLIGPNTQVTKRGHDALLDPSVISVGQAVTVRGTVTTNDQLDVIVDATNGAVRMRITHLSGIANVVNPGQIDIRLHSIDRRRADVFDFTGTGASRDLDADPANYEVSAGALPLDTQATGKPVVAFGFPTSFGAAPPDFEGRTFIDFSDLRSSLGVGWGSSGTTAPFLSADDSGLVLDHLSADIDERHFIKQGPVPIDLTSLASGAVIVPTADGRNVFVIKRGNSLRLYRDFDDFTADVTIALDGSTAARALYARGTYDAGSNTFTAFKIAITLLETSP